jgi:eukaryotic-like serine/threonine-protein kinase
MPDATSDPRAETIEELLRSAPYEAMRPHGRMQRFEDPFPVTEALPALKRGARLRLQEVIGEGGMGTVHLAHQPALNRMVAVKTLRADQVEPGSLQSFLQEARVTGLVEHPNVVPVYDLVGADGGAPALVMKRVDGMPWPRVLADPSLVPAEYEADPLGWHLRVLMAICDAAQYAHEIGIIHRDIKPDNVMVGRLGEIYLLDWGLAVSLRSAHGAFIALASEVEDLAGTPAYMAPEMLAAPPSDLSPATDVYLLGASLHEVITGAPPHDGKDLHEVLRNAFESARLSYSAEVPAELAAICLKAMAREPSARFSSAAELRAALERFFTHRESRELAQAGVEALRELEQRIADASEESAAIEDAFGALRFSFGQALSLWPGNEHARAAWQRAIRSMAGFALSRRRAAAAASLLAELSPPDEALSAALRQLRNERARRAEEVQHLRTMQHEHDPAVSGTIRSRAALMVGAIWFAIGVTAGRARATGAMDLDDRWFVGAGVALLAMLLGLIVVRRELLANQVNRRIMIVMVGGALAVIFGRVATALHEQDFLVAVAREQLIFALQVALIGIISDARIIFGAFALVITSALSTWVPDLGLEWSALGVLVSACWMSRVWRRAR